MGFGQILCDLDVSDEDQFYLFTTLDADGSGTIDLGEMLDGIAKLRGGARRSDIVALALTINSIQMDIQFYMDVSEDARKQQNEMTAMLLSLTGKPAPSPLP